MAGKQTNATSGVPNKDAARWKSRFENRQNKLRPVFEAAQKYYDIMYAVQNTSKVSPWKSKVYVPILASKAWDLIARMSDVVPWFNVEIKGEVELDDVGGNFYIPEEVQARKRRIEAKLHQDYENGHEEPMKLKVFDPLVDAVVAGTGYAYAPWCFKEQKSYGRPFDDNGLMDNENVVVKKLEAGYNDFEGVNFFNVFPADGSSFYKAPYLIIRGFKPKVDMESSGLYKNLDRCSTQQRTPSDEFDLYNVSRNRVVNEENLTWKDEDVDIITYYECYERTSKGVTLTTYAEGESSDPSDMPWVEIRPTSVPYWHNMFPVVPFYLRKKSYSVFGESLFENNRTLQSAVNDLFNHYLDNWNLSVDGMIMYEDGTLTNDYIVEPGGEITYTGEAPKQFKFPEPNPQQLSVVMNVIEKGVDAATFSPYASGNPTDSSDKTQGTAYGVKTISEAATTKIGFFRDNFKQSMKTLGRIWLSNLQQFSDNPEEIRREENGQPVPDLIMPSDYQGELELDIDDDSMTPMTKADKRDAFDAYVQNVLMLQKAAIEQANIFKQPSDIPRLNFHEILDDAANLYQQKSSARYFLDSKVEIPAEQTDDTKEYVNMAYKDASPFIKSQIEARYGFQPDPVHELEATTQHMAEGTAQANAQGIGLPYDGTTGQTQPTTSQGSTGAQ
jgi:hypothetical protein